jgi:hypothetical protein
MIKKELIEFQIRNKGLLIGRFELFASLSNRKIPKKPVEIPKKLSMRGKFLMKGERNSGS